MKKILLLLIGVVVVVGVVLYATKETAPQTPVVDTKPAETTQKPADVAKVNMLTFAENATGTAAVVEHAKLAQPGYVVVYRIGAEEKVAMTGHSALLTAGEHRNVNIALDGALKTNDILVGVLHADNGDGKFDDSDAPVVEKNTYISTVDVVDIPKAAADIALSASVEAFLNGKAQETAKKDGMEAQKNVVEVTVRAENYKFLPGTIKAKLGQTVKVTFINDGGLHDFVIDEFKGAKTAQIQGGKTETIEFVVDQKGSFEYYCSVGSHRAMGMVGTLIVE